MRSAGEPVVVDFWAPWCRPCKALEPILEELDATVPVAKLNIDEIRHRRALRRALDPDRDPLRRRRAAPRGRRHPPRSALREWLGEVLPAGSSTGSTSGSHDACAFLAAADHGEVERVGRRRKQLVVLAEAEVVDRRARRRAGRARARSRAGSRSAPRCARRRPRARPRCRASRVAARASRGPPRRAAAAARAALAERGARAAERPGHDEEVARPRAGAARAPDRPARAR